MSDEQNITDEMVERAADDACCYAWESFPNNRGKPYPGLDDPENIDAKIIIRLIARWHLETVQKQMRDSHKFVCQDCGQFKYQDAHLICDECFAVSYIKSPTEELTKERDELKQQLANLQAQVVKHSLTPESTPH